MNFLTKNAPEFSPRIFSLDSVGQKNPAKFPTKFPCEKSKTNHRRASVGAQGELFLGSEHFSIFFSVLTSSLTPIYRMSRPKKDARFDPRKKTIYIPNNRMQNIDTEKEISIPKRRLRLPRCHKKDISIPKRDAPDLEDPRNLGPLMLDSCRSPGQKTVRN